MSATGGRALYTWSAQKAAVPLDIVSAEGVRFTTADGARWWDLGSMTWNAAFGQGHPAMRHALAQAAERGFVPCPSAVFPDKTRAAELLAEVAPAGLGTSFICLSGAEANENAVKMARQITGRHRVVTRTRSYHGATLAMLSLSGDPRRAPFEPGYPGVVRWDDPYSATACAGDLDELFVRENPATVAAVLLEGVVGANGVLVPPRGYWRRIREICDKRGVLLIADEVLSGFGRTGRFWAVDHDGVSPDLLTTAKGLTGGYAPGGAVLVSDRVARHFDDVVLQCGLTAYAHPLTCAAIVAAIGVVRDEKLVSRAARLGDWLRPRLGTMAATRPYVQGIRGLGLLWAIDLDADAGRQRMIAAALRRHHVHAHRRDHMVFLAPPLVIGEGELGEAVDALFTAIDQAFPDRR